jgi:hypothetical protein
MRTYLKGIRKLFVVGIAFLMLGIFGMFGSGADTATDDNDSAPCELPEASRSAARAPEIAGYLQLTDSSGNPYEGNYGPSDSFYFYLDSSYSTFRIYLKNIDYEDRWIDQMNTTLKRGSTPASVIKITQQYYNRSWDLNPGNYDNFDYSLEFGVNADIGAYQLVVDIRFTVITQTWESIDRSGKIYISLIFSSRMRTDSGGVNLRLSVTDQTGTLGTLYSGATNQLISLPDVYSASSFLDDVEFTLYLPSSFTLQSNVASVNEVRTYSYDDPLWMLNYAGTNDAKAQEIAGTFDIIYKRSGTQITEKKVPVTIEITRTPIVSLDDQIVESDIGTIEGDDYVSNLEIYQGTTSESFNLKFTNTGNINLKDVKVELFTDNAAFFFKSKFYYDENANSYKRAYGKTVELGDVATGGSVIKKFSTEIIKNLPPGLYRIPIRYTAKYTLGLIDLEFDVDDYHEEISASRATNNEGFTPFILVNVIEGDDENDNMEPDMIGTTNTHLKPGMHNVLLAVELTNLENYQLNSLNAEISVGYPSPLQPLNEVNRTPRKISAQEKDIKMYGANDPVFSNTYTAHFLVDVYQEILSGVYEVPVTITCLDPFNQERISSVIVLMNIAPVPPKFVISDATTDAIRPNDYFNLTVEIFNCGGCIAKNVMVMFNGSSNLFSAKEGIQGPSNIYKNNEMEFEFEIFAGEVEPGRTYNPSLLLSYNDDSGNFYPFDASSKLTIPIQIDEAKPPLMPNIVVTDVSTNDISPNSNFTLYVKVYNAGESAGKNVRLMFNGSSNLFSAAPTIMGPKYMLQDEETTFGFTIKTGEVEPGKTYTSSILMSYEDSAGNVYSFDSNPEEPIELQVKYVEPEPIIKIQKVKDESINIDEGLAVVLLGVFILISVIIFAVIRAKLTKKGKASGEDDANGRVTPGQGMDAGGFRKQDSTIIDMTATAQYAPAPQQYVSPEQQVQVQAQPQPQPQPQPPAQVQVPAQQTVGVYEQPAQTWQAAGTLPPAQNPAQPLTTPTQPVAEQ